jgi:integrase
MSPARRRSHRRNWPRGLYEPRPGYYVWRHPGTGQTLAIGHVPLPVAINQAMHANAHVMQAAPTLVDKLEGKTETVASVLAIMPLSEKTNTAKSQRSLDKRISAKLGRIACSSLSVKHCAELVDEVLAEGKGRLAQAVRSRLIGVCAKAMTKGWMTFNPAEATEKVEVEVKRDRLSLEQFNAVLAVADQVAEWLPLAMRLALVTGQDRATIAHLKRSQVRNMEGGKHLVVQRSKTKDTNAPVAIPLGLSLAAAECSLADLLAIRTGVVSPFVVHHVKQWGNAPVGSQVHPDRISHAFTEARVLAGIPDVMPSGKGAPTFHEIRSLSKRLYDKQGDVDTKALLGHASYEAAALYSDARGTEPVEPIRVQLGKAK